MKNVVGVHFLKAKSNLVKRPLTELLRILPFLPVLQDNLLLACIVHELEEHPDSLLVLVNINHVDEILTAKVC